MLIDSAGRQVTYLRVSITDRCNLRCVYCMPPEGVERKSHDQIMRYDEIARFVRLVAAEGVTEVRLTGGEPLVRKDLASLVEMIAAIPEIKDISLTTNGIFLADQIDGLAKAGLKRINVSLDTLDKEKFRRITRGGDIDRVMDGIHAAESAGLHPIKINTVMLNGVNSDELEDIARLSLSHPWQVRFIELMPVQNLAPWGEGFPAPETMYFPATTLLERLKPLGLEAMNSKVGNGPAQEYHLNGAAGTIGVITPLSEAFCNRCNRLRLTADGNLRPCLLWDVEVPILEAMRNGEEILPLVQKALELKPKGHELFEHRAPQTRCMMQIGG
ncbi:MAG TPA: GTP 3',8-cyclase MoaA [Longilinea sp.]|nr:GTP 3',8-cyclase MoaA [Longilinea sp.]